jgi:hypothetical protein
MSSQSESVAVDLDGDPYDMGTRRLFEADEVEQLAAE